MLIEENIRRMAGVEISREQTLSKKDVKELLIALKDVDGVKSIDNWKKALKAVSNGGTIEIKS